MNILYINHYAGSPGMGMEFRPYYLAREWIKLGHKVTIIAGDYSHLRKNNPSVEKDFQTEEIDAIEYVWLRTGAYEGNGLKRAVTMVRFVRKLWRYAKTIATNYEPDVVIASSTYPLDTYPAQRIAKISKARYIHEVHDMWPSTLYEVGEMSKKHPFVLLMQIAENSAYKHCDFCVSLPPFTKDYMVQHGLKPEKFINIQNGVVEEEWINYKKISFEHKSFFDQHRDKFIVGYFGGHAISNALDKSLDIAKQLLQEDDQIAFVFIGDGVEKKRLIKRTEEEGITNASFLPPVDKRSIPDLLQYFDCSYMTGEDSPLYRFGLCLNKLYDSMMAGKPIICAFNAPDTLVEQYGCGIQCDPKNMMDVIEAIKTIKNMTKDKRTEMGHRGQTAVLQNYTYEKLASRFAELFGEERKLV